MASYILSITAWSPSGMTEIVAKDWTSGKTFTGSSIEAVRKQISEEHQV